MECKDSDRSAAWEQTPAWLASRRWQEPARRAPDSMPTLQLQGRCLQAIALLALMEASPSHVGNSTTTAPRPHEGSAQPARWPPNWRTNERPRAKAKQNSTGALACCCRGQALTAKCSCRGPMPRTTAAAFSLKDARQTHGKAL